VKDFLGEDFLGEDFLGGDATLEDKGHKFWRVFSLEGGSGRNYKTDREKVLSRNKQKPVCIGLPTICHSIGEIFQDHAEFQNQKCPVRVNGLLGPHHVTAAVSVIVSIRPRV
jgi:hypothetical protein